LYTHSRADRSVCNKMSNKEKKEKSQSIEETLAQKSSEAKVAVDSELEKQFRDKYQKQNDIIAKQFPDVPRSEFVLDHHACAHLGKILKQGRLFITPRFILFYANLLGTKVKKKILFENIVEITKTTQSLVAAPIEIHLKFKRFTFASFLNRDRCYNHLMLQWKLNKDGHPEIIKIPLDENVDVNEDDDEEDTDDRKSLKAADTDDGLHEMPKMESMWSQSDGAILSDEPAPKRSTERNVNKSRIPMLYRGSSSKSGRSCFDCFKGSGS